MAAIFIAIGVLKGVPNGDHLILMLYTARGGHSIVVIADIWLSSAAARDTLVPGNLCQFWFYVEIMKGIVVITDICWYSWNSGQTGYIKPMSLTAHTACKKYIYVSVLLIHLPLHGQNGRHFADDIFKCFFMNEKFCIAIQIPLKFVPEGPVYNNPALVEIIAWRRIGDKPLSEPMLTRFIEAYMRH